MDDWRVLVGVAVMVAVLVVFFQALERAAEREYADRKDARANGTARAVAAYATVNRPQLPALQTLTYGPHSQVQQLPVPERAALPDPVVAESAAPALPGVTTLGQVLDTGFWPSWQAILLGQGPGGVLHTVPVKAMLHLLLIGPTNIGKSTIERLIVPQLQAIGAETSWWNPHYTPHDPETDEEWAALAAHTCEGRALVDEAEILAALEHLATVELPARKARYRQGQAPGVPRFYIIDEAPILAGYDKRFMEWLGAVLREGRKFGLFVIMATQDALVSTLGGHSGMRAQAQTIYYGGGDRYSAKALLGFAPADPPGQGVVWLKSAATPDVPQVRVPWPQNADLARLYQRAPAVSPVSPPFPSVSGLKREPVSGEVIQKRPAPPAEMDPARVEAVREAVQAGMAQGQILEQVWAVKAGGGAAYKAATDEFRAILAYLVGR